MGLNFGAKNVWVYIIWLKYLRFNLKLGVKFELKYLGLGKMYFGFLIG